LSDWFAPPHRRMRNAALPERRPVAGAPICGPFSTVSAGRPPSIASGNDRPERDLPHSRTMSVIDALWSTRVVPMCRNVRYRPASEKSVGYMCRIYVLVEDHFDAANHAQVRPDALFWRVAIRECRDYRKVVSSPYRLLMWNCPPLRRAFFTALRLQRRGPLCDRAQITNGRKKK